MWSRGVNRLAMTGKSLRVARLQSNHLDLVASGLRRCAAFGAGLPGVLAPVQSRAGGSSRSIATASPSMSTLPQVIDPDAPRSRPCSKILRRWRGFACCAAMAGCGPTPPRSACARSTTGSIAAYATGFFAFRNPAKDRMMANWFIAAEPRQCAAGGAVRCVRRVREPSGVSQSEHRLRPLRRRSGSTPILQPQDVRRTTLWLNPLVQSSVARLPIFHLPLHCSTN